MSAPGERFDGYAQAPPAGDWSYIVDDFGISYGPGWWPFYRDGKPSTVRLAPNVAYYAWRNEYVLIRAAGAAGAAADLRLWVRAQGMGGIVAPARVSLDIRAQTSTVHNGDRLPRELRTQAATKADRLLAFILEARRQRRRGAAAPPTAHELYELARAGGES